MNTEGFARKMTGGEMLTNDQKKQIREQQEVSSICCSLFRKCSFTKILILHDFVLGLLEYYVFFNVVC